MSGPTTSPLAGLAASIAPAMVTLRRDLHRNPEVGWSEHRTTRVIAQHLLAAGLEPHIRPAGVGLVVEVGHGEPVVGFRADLDALPIAEEATTDYRSVSSKAMHACGHDVHSAVATGIAIALVGTDRPPGTVRFVFQPAEEQMPGGAVTLVQEGVHEGMSAILAFHVDPALAPGMVGLRAGGVTGASDRFTLRLSGPGGHTSRPHQTVDLVGVAGKVITELPQLVRRGIDPRHTVLVVFGVVAGGTAENVIPSHLELGGTVRMFDLDLWRMMPKLLEQVVTDIATALGAAIDVDYQRGSPPVMNHAGVVAVVEEAARLALGPAGVTTTHQSLGSEDFAWYLDAVPGALVRLGAALPDRVVDLHSTTFDVDERSIETGIHVGAAALLALLAEAG